MTGLIVNSQKSIVNQKSLPLTIDRLRLTLSAERGIALVVVIAMMVILLSITGAALLFSGLDLKATGTLKTGTIALQVADAGIHHALSVIPPGTSFSYSTDPNSPTCVVPSSSCSTEKFDFGGGYSYTVTAINTAGNTQAILTATAFGPNGAKKVVVAYVGRGGFGLGATSLPGSPADKTETNFSGTAFSINGNDNCNTAPAPLSPVPGIVVTDPALATEITNNTTSDGGLASNQMANVTGVGGSPSVGVIGALSQSVSEIANAFLNHPTQPHTTLAGGQNFSGNETWGTADEPRITYINGSAQISGTREGYGVLIVDGPLDIAGTFTFHGLVIARGDIQVQVAGTAGIYGSLLIGESTVLDGAYDLDVRGNATIRFDSCALSPAGAWVPLPQKARILAWQEKLV